MSIIEKIREKNPNRIFYELSDPKFNQFGRLLDYKVDQAIVDYMLKEAKFPKARNVYVASDENLERFPLKTMLENDIYSGLSCQFGYCNGLVSHINGFEFHQCSEVFISITDSILALIRPHQPLGSGEPYKIDHSYLFYVPAGTVLELYPLSGHFSPIRVYEEGYRTLIILTKGTNEALNKALSVSESQNHLLQKDNMNKGFAINKWLYVHKDRMDLVEKGAHLHVIGDNSPIKVL